MSTFSEANQVRLMLKMKLSHYAWYSSCGVFTMDDGFGVIINVHHLDNKVRKLIAPVTDGVTVKTELE